jgi:glutamate-1-semialdehyde aminotransferase
MTIPGFTSTGSKRPEALFGSADGVPLRMVRADGCNVWDADGKEYVDTVMALGAVALGYAHPAVTLAAERAVRAGTVGPLAPAIEQELATQLATVLPGVEAVRFCKTGAEAVAAAVRIARVVTGRERVITCGYHGWHDWCHDAPGVPEAVRGLRHQIPFNDPEALDHALAVFGPPAAIVVEPVIDGPPSLEWLEALRQAATRHDALLVFDEIKTAFRVAVGGAAERWGVTPDLMVVGKALGNGFPLAAVGGPAGLMDAVTRTWVSSTLATEYVSLAAAAAVLDTYGREPVIEHLEQVGTHLFRGLEQLAHRYPGVVTGVCGLPQMCHLTFGTEAQSGGVARAAAQRGLLFKRTAYNFVSLAHSDDTVAGVLERLEGAIDEVAGRC